MSTNTAVAKDQKPVFEITKYIGSDTFKGEVAKCLPKHLTPERFARISLTCIRKTPKLAQCTQESLLGCLMQLSQFGLEPDGRRAYLIPFENRKAGTVECTLIVSYMGLAELVMRSGLVSTIHADVVREGDIFEYSMGVLADHVPWFLRRDHEKPDDEGQVYAAYATVLNKDGTRQCVVMSVSEIEKIRSMSRGKDQDPWRIHWNEMAKKTTFRRLSKWLVLSAEVREAAEVEDEDDVVETTATRKQPLRISEIVEAAEGAVESELLDDRRSVEPESKEEPKVEEAKPKKSKKLIDDDVTDPSVVTAPKRTTFKVCCDFVDELTMNERNGMKYVGKGESAGVLMFTLPNGETLSFGDGACSEGSVDTLQSDAKERIEAIVTRAIQMAERREAK